IRRVRRNKGRGACRLREKWRARRGAPARLEDAPDRCSVLAPGDLIPERGATAANRGADERALLAADRGADPGANARGRADDDRALLHPPGLTPPRRAPPAATTPGEEPMMIALFFTDRGSRRGSS